MTKLRNAVTDVLKKADSYVGRLGSSDKRESVYKFAAPDDERDSILNASIYTPKYYHALPTKSFQPNG